MFRSRSRSRRNRYDRHGDDEAFEGFEDHDDPLEVTVGWRRADMMAEVIERFEQNLEPCSEPEGPIPEKGEPAPEPPAGAEEEETLEMMIERMLQEEKEEE